MAQETIAVKEAVRDKLETIGLKSKAAVEK